MADLGHTGLVFRAEFPQYEIYLPSPAEVITYADPDTGIILRTEHLSNVCQSVMSTGTASLPQTQSTERQIQIVRNDYKVFYGDFRFVQPRGQRQLHEVTGSYSLTLITLPLRVTSTRFSSEQHCSIELT